MDSCQELIEAVRGKNAQLDGILSDIDNKFSILYERVERVLDFFGIPIDDNRAVPHELMKYALPHKRAALVSLLHQLDTFRDKSALQDTNHYVFDTLHFSKVQTNWPSSRLRPPRKQQREKDKKRKTKKQELEFKV